MQRFDKSHLKGRSWEGCWLFKDDEVTKAAVESGKKQKYFGTGRTVTPTSSLRFRAWVTLKGDPTKISPRSPLSLVLAKYSCRISAEGTTYPSITTEPRSLQEDELSFCCCTVYSLQRDSEIPNWWVRTVQNIWVTSYFFVLDWLCSSLYN